MPSPAVPSALPGFIAQPDFLVVTLSFPRAERLSEDLREYDIDTCDTSSLEEAWTLITSIATSRPHQLFVLIGLFLI